MTKPMDADEMTRAVAARNAEVLHRAMQDAWKLPGVWEQYLHNQAHNPRRTPEEQAAWQRAHDLFFTLLPQSIAALQQTVADAIAREFDEPTGQSIAKCIREAQLEGDA